MTIILRIRQLKFLVHVIRKEGLKNLKPTEHIDDTRGQTKTVSNLPNMDDGARTKMDGKELNVAKEYKFMES